VEDLQVARFFEVDPDVVSGWSNADFLDRQEYMWFQMDIDQREIKRAEQAAKNGR
jgi:hypothetical protein